MKEESELMYRISACPNKINWAGRVILMIFQKVVRTTEAMSGDRWSYGKDNARACTSNFKSPSLPIQSSKRCGLLAFAKRQL